MSCFLFFFFNDAATTEIYTLSLHDALPISGDPLHLNALLRRPLPGLADRVSNDVHRGHLPSALSQIDSIPPSPAAHVKGPAWRQRARALGHPLPCRDNRPPFPGREPSRYISV